MPGRSARFIPSCSSTRPPWDARSDACSQSARSSMYARTGLAEPVDRELREPAAGELEHHEVDRVRVPGGVEAARVPRVDGLGQLPEEVEQEVDEMAARLEERPVGHGRAPGHRLVPRGQVHELRHLAEDEAADVRLADLVLHGTEDGLRAVLVVHGDLPSG